MWWFSGILSAGLASPSRKSPETNSAHDDDELAAVPGGSSWTGYRSRMRSDIDSTLLAASSAAAASREASAVCLVWLMRMVIVRRRDGVAVPVLSPSSSPSPSPPARMMALETGPLAWPSARTDGLRGLAAHDTDEARRLEQGEEVSQRRQDLICVSREGQDNILALKRDLVDILGLVYWVVAIAEEGLAVDVDRLRVSDLVLSAAGLAGGPVGKVELDGGGRRVVVVVTISAVDSWKGFEGTFTGKVPRRGSR
ncbi:hypothetical protein ColLi_13987 [Colletotrichum liriopes]|uniref:Uncharacterized protein n=1 Tax=Colletotrichum liriopes TaxID=708192 RepID=A0AA37M092_9PEZI|nr:hypothetical protein ColLi_13987 [Colletotrichum liriopes]